VFLTALVASAVAASLAPAPARVVRECRALQPGRVVQVLCPPRLPEGRWHIGHRTLRDGRCAYLTDIETAPAGSGEAFHVLAGGRCAPFPQATSGGRWPARLPDRRAADDMLGLIGSLPLRPGQPGTAPQRRVRLRVIRRAWVNGHPALLLAVSPFESGGGVHGGHIAAVWNQGGDGYVLSAHFGHAGEGAAREREVLGAAAAMSRSRAAA